MGGYGAIDSDGIIYRVLAYHPEDLTAAVLAARYDDKVIGETASQQRIPKRLFMLK